ncbi:MAG: sodium/solute symporter [Ignavibacteriales bacterium]|nr:sodium/solute symporter [Ignavibacteriales bacterium]
MDKTLDYLIIIAFLIGVALFGIFKGGKQNTVEDYFLGSKNVPWWAVMFSIVAAETSTLTFISIPGLAYLTNLNFLQVTFGYLIGRIIIAVFFLPSYFTGELNTAYAFLENRFGQKTRSFSSIVFLFTRTAADGVRLFATAIPLKLMLGIDYTTAIVIIAIITLAYTITGGVKGIIWVDVILMGIYLGGALLAGYFLVSHYLPDGFNSIITAAQADDKLSIINLGFNSGSIAEFFAQPYTLISGLLGGAFLSMASHGTDQLIVQRLLSTQNLKQAQKAIVGSGIIVIFQFVIFLVVGVALYAFYGKLNLRSDEVFPKFIIESLPTPYSGIIIAGLFAAAMSTLAGSISALSSSTMLDLYQPFKKSRNKNNDLKVSRMFTIFWAIMLIFAALFFMNSPQTVVELALSIASFTYGGLLGTFMLGLFVKNAKQEDALAAFTGGIFVMVTVISLQLVAWTWFTIIGVAATLLIGTFLSYLSNNKI